MSGLNVLLIGEDAAGIRTLQSLRRGSHRVIAVMASASRQNSASLWRVARQFGYTTWPAQLVKDPDFALQIRKHCVDIILNIHSLFLIRKEVLEAPRLGSYNLHPGPLPRYAGLNSVCWAIYNDEKKHGVTLHKMEAEVDAGPIVYQEFLEIGPEETGLSLTIKCVNAGVTLVDRLLQVAAQDPSKIPLIPQDLTKREYFGREIPQNGNLSWYSPAQRISNFVRACDFSPFHSPWGHPRTGLRGQELGIVKASLIMKTSEAQPGTVGKVSDVGVEVACADEWILVQKVFREGKRVSASAILGPGDQLHDLPSVSHRRWNINE
jgi:methionyl-tRNA formyltransferase